jgi:hypothetical protein
MNLLVNVLLQAAIAPQPGQNRMSLGEVAELLHVGLLDPTSAAEAEALERARIRFLPAGQWRARAPREPLPDGYEPSKWSAAVPVGGHDVVAFVPEDDRPAQEVMLFSGVGPLAGRLRLWLPDGPGSDVRGVTFEASLHCVDAACDTDDDCGSCCPGCLCRERQDGPATVLVCSCPAHNVFPPSR